MQPPPRRLTNSGRGRATAAISASAAAGPKTPNLQSISNRLARVEELLTRLLERAGQPEQAKRLDSVES
ncbi:MAG: hypothetical protein STHCBS139747_001525 [Sporothrix thermara]